MKAIELNRGLMILKETLESVKESRLETNSRATMLSVDFILDMLSCNSDLEKEIVQDWTKWENEDIPAFKEKVFYTIFNSKEVCFKHFLMFTDSGILNDECYLIRPINFNSINHHFECLDYSDFMEPFDHIFIAEDKSMIFILHHEGAIFRHYF